MTYIEASDKFSDYLSRYDDTNPKIKLKIDHTYRVVNFSKELAIANNLSSEDVELAMIIGLLHDIGRFDQIKDFDTFNDHKSFDHGNYGKEIIQSLFMDIDEIVIKAVVNHNKYIINDNLSERELLFTKIIRDSDKLDIINIFLNNPDYIKKDAGLISAKVLEQALKCESVDHKLLVTKMDNYISALSLIFDFNFKYSIKKIQEEKPIQKLLDKLKLMNHHELNNLEKIEQVINNFIERKDC